MSQLEEIKARAEKATPGPWVAFEGNEADGVNCADDEQLTWDDHGGEVFKPANAEFIAHARTDVPKLIAALKAVLHLHQESDGDYRDFTDQQWQGKHCEACRDEWPCDTAEAITEALQ